MAECKKIYCQKWKEKQEQILDKSESIFDAVLDMDAFEIKCLKDCPYKKEEEQ